MFGKKKEVVEYDGLPVLLSKREAFDRFTGRITSRFLAYRIGDKWKGLVGYEQYKEEQELRDKLSCKIEQKLNLILNHLNLTYQPETEKKEPARLIPKVKSFEEMYPGITISCSGGSYGIGADTAVEPTKPKKKRGRPKKK